MIKKWEWQGQKFKVAAGQFITSLDSLAQEAGVSIQNVRSALKKFEEKYQFLTNISTKTGRLITVVNWGIYQGDDEEGSKDSNKEVTKSQQRGNKEVTTNKNDKNDNNDKEIIIVLTQEEQQIINVLKTVKDYPLDREKDLDMIKRLTDKHPKVDLQAAIKSWSIYKLDHPLKEKDNPRAQINTWCSNCVKYNRDIKKDAPKKEQGKNDKYKDIYMS